MYKVVTAEQMRRIDERAIRDRGISAIVLMERAGEAVAREALERFEPESVAILAGKGNNGGDGFVAARHLRESGVHVHVFAMCGAAQLRGEALEAFKHLPDNTPLEILNEERAGRLDEKLREFDLIIDALLGTGSRGAAAGLVALVIEAANSTRVPILAVDIPSGLNADGGISDGPHIRAAATVTIGLPKLGLVLDPGMRSAGTVTIADIGFPSDLLEDPAISVNILGLDDAAKMLPERDPAGHKGSFGRTLILAGSEGMTGAAALASRAAARSGVGLVYCAYPAPLGPIMESLVIEPVKHPLQGEEKWFTSRHIAAALSHAEGVQSVALGPGFGMRTETREFAATMIHGIECPMTLDADALNLLAGNLDWLRARPGPTVLTPHPGEAARLLNCSVKEIEENRLEAGTSLARDYKAVVVLKGSRTISTSPDGQRYINPTGNSGLAKGGSGDILTGLIAGLLAQGSDPLDAVLLGVFLHGLAADRAAAKLGVRAMTASDVIEYLGEAFLCLEEARPHN